MNFCMTGGTFSASPATRIQFGRQRPLVGLYREFGIAAPFAPQFS
jgi:hypothetical protein